jgi:hypothetical protein
MDSTRALGPLIPVLAGLTGCGEHLLPHWAEDEGADEATDDDDIGESSGSTSGTSDESTSTSTSSTSDTDDTSTTDDTEGGGPFFITAVGIGVGSSIPLTFSEPVGPLAGVDPQAFRISMARTWWYEDPYYGSNGFSSYYDMAYYDYDPGKDLFVIQALTTGPGVNQTTLHLDKPIPSSICAYINEFNDYGYEMSEMTLLLHHAAGPIPIHSSAEVPLANFGEDWVLGGQSGDYVYEPGFPNLGTRVDIPCP